MNLANSEEVILPKLYINGHTIMRLVMPTTEDLDNLPIHDITAEESWLRRQTPTMPIDITKLRGGKAVDRS
jgi:hypothetical protein